MAGRRLLHYELLKKIGEGGMGVVYKARDHHLDRFVAVKVLRPEAMGSEDRRRRFFQEAKAASALNSPYIVTVYDAGSADDVAFIAMEFVDGRTLAETIPSNGLPLGRLLPLAVQIAEALATAHARGILHRDLKPANIMITSDGLVKVVDFGLAKLLEAIRQESTTLTVAPHTEEGKIAGTAAYMSPEQAQGLPSDSRTDVFSFGAVLYEMATGRRAF